MEPKKITYKQKMSSADIWRYLKAIIFPLSIFILAMFAIEGLAGFGSKLVAPLTGAMWAMGAFSAIMLPSQRGSILSTVHVTIGVYLVTLVVLKRIIVMMSGVSSEMLMAAFNQAIPVTSGTSISGWLQTMIWITAVMTPLGYIGMEAKRIFTFKRRSSKERAMDEIRGIHPNK